MYPVTKVQSIWRNPDYVTKFVQKDMSDKNLQKINIKIVISL